MTLSVSTAKIIDLTRTSVLMSKSVRAMAAFAARIRYEAIKAIGQAGSGHPGGSLSIAEALAVVFLKHLRIDPNNPTNPNRDRFVLSKGHAAPALYAVLASLGFFPKGDLNRLRQIESHLQGHPDMRKTPGVDLSTGRLGAGLGAAIGMAIDNKINSPAALTVACVGDGEMTEGVCLEALALAGQLKLNKLIVLFDQNQLGLGGPTARFSTWDVGRIAAEMNWQVIKVKGHDVGQLDKAMKLAKRSTSKPTIIVMDTVKGQGVSFMAGQADWHGAAPKPADTAKALAEIEPYLDESLVDRFIRQRLLKPLIDQPSVKPAFVPIEIDLTAFAKSQPTRNAFGDWLVKVMEQQTLGAGKTALLSVDPDLGKATMAVTAQKTFGLMNDGDPQARCLEVGVREALMMAVGAGLASRGNFIPVLSTFAAFTYVGLDLAIQLQIANHLSTIVVGTHAGLQVGPDGKSHMSLRDQEIWAAAGAEVYVPGDSQSTAKILTWLYNSQASDPRLVYVSCTRSAVPQLEVNPALGLAEVEEVDPAKGYRILKPTVAPDDARTAISLVANGAMLETALKVARLINESQQYAVNVTKIVDAFAPTSFAQAAAANPDIFHMNSAVVTMNDATASTLGDPVMKYLFTVGQNAKVLSFGGDPDTARSGSIPDVLRDQGLLPEQIAARILEGF